MTDNEIIKALECCYRKGDTPCRDCPFNEFEDCNDVLMADYVFNLINRQQAEIERLKEQPYTFQIEVSKKIESEIRAKVIKEFAERLKNKIISDTAYGCDCNQHSGYYDYRIKIGDIPEYIDNLVKEMVGEAE